VEKEQKYIERRAKEEGISSTFIPIINEMAGSLNKYEMDEKKYRYEYSDGSKIEILETDNGFVSIILKNDKGEININSYLPAGWQIKIYKKDRDFHCNYHEKLIGIGRITGPKVFLDILHEIGHAIHNNGLSDVEHKKDDSIHDDLSTSSESEKLKHYSVAERMGWANALKLARRLKNEIGVDVLEVFSSLEDLQKYIYTCLSTYRYTGEMMLANENLISKPISNLRGWFRSNFGQIISDEEMKFLEGLYDKKKLSRVLDVDKKF